MRMIYYKDWDQGPIVTFSPGWPLNADAWDGHLLFLGRISVPSWC
jgi:non-heme chloroperoxidase